MRILQVVHDFLPRHQAGSELYTYHLSQALLQAGHDVQLCFTEYRGGHETGAGDGRVQQFTFDGLTCHEIAFSTFLPTLDSMYEVPAVAAAFRRVLAALRPDVVHFQTLLLFGPSCVEWAVDAGAAVVLTLHDYNLSCLHHGRLQLPDGQLCRGPEPLACARCAQELVNVRVWFARNHWPPDRERWAALGAPMVTRRLERLRAATARVHLAVAPSRFLLEQLADVAVPRALLVHHDYGFPPLRPVPRVPRTGPLRVGFLGTISDYKGVHLLVEAIARLGPAAPVACAIHGDPTWFPDYVARLRERLPPQVQFAGPCPRERIPEVLAALDVLVVPSTWYENSPLTIHEARQAGVPVVTAALGGMAELVQDGRNGRCFVANDAADLARVLGELSADPAQVERLGMDRSGVTTIADDAAWMAARYREILARLACAPQ